jgi:hypothetical protein
LVFTLSVSVEGGVEDTGYTFSQVAPPPTVAENEALGSPVMDIVFAVKVVPITPVNAAICGLAANGC